MSNSITGWPYFPPQSNPNSICHYCNFNPSDIFVLIWLLTFSLVIFMVTKSPSIIVSKADDKFFIEQIITVLRLGYIKYRSFPYFFT